MQEMTWKSIRNLVILLGLCLIATPYPLIAENAFYDWQYQQLFHPTPNQRQAEEHGSLFIYDGFSDREVSLAMDQQFARIQHMMFVRTVITDHSGQAEIDDATGEAIIEDDGCDD